MKTVKDIFYFVEDVMTITGLSRSKSYKIIADLNRELSDRGYLLYEGMEIIKAILQGKTAEA